MMTWISTSPRLDGRVAGFGFSGSLVARATTRVRPYVWRCAKGTGLWDHLGEDGF